MGLTMWHKEFISCENHLIGKGFSFLFGKHLKYKINISVVNVYAPYNGSERMLYERSPII